MADFLAFPRVRAHVLARLNATSLNGTSRAALLALLPDRFDITLRPRLLRGGLGAAAERGHYAFNVYWGTTASWMVVVSPRGELEMMPPAPSFGERQEDGGEALARTRGSSAHFCALKGAGSGKLLLGSNEN